jgi:hypothetical protein
LKKRIGAGFSGAVYWQTTEVRGEVDGFMTFDLKMEKMNIPDVKKVDQEVVGAIQN